MDPTRVQRQTGSMPSWLTRNVDRSSYKVLHDGPIGLTQGHLTIAYMTGLGFT